MLVKLNKGKEFHMHIKGLDEELSVDLPVIDGNLPAEGVEAAYIDAVYVLVQRVRAGELEEIAGPLPRHIEAVLKGKDEVRVAFIYTKVSEFMLAARFLEEANARSKRSQ
jgi:hypothetical protein